MKIRYSEHRAYHHQYHIAWIPKYCRKILIGELKKFIEARLFGIQAYHPKVEIEKYSVQEDHVHLVITIPPKYSVSSIVGKIKDNASREVRLGFDKIKKIYCVGSFGLPDIFRQPLESVRSS
jgi:putative transposase